MTGSNRRLLRRSTPLTLVVACTAGYAGHALAQTQLPGITVTSPSPVAKPKPQPAPVAPPSAPAATQSSVPPPAEPALPEVVIAPPPGTLIVVDDAFVPVTVVTGGEVDAKQGATITDTLMTKPGVAGSTFTAGSSRPVVRGLDNARVRVQENGIGSGDVSTLSEDHAVPIDPFAAARIEVVRGPATLRYGSQAIGGVVSVENERIPTFVPPRGVIAEGRGAFTSVDEGREGAFQVTAGVGNFAVHADMFRRDAADYDTPRGRQENTFVKSDGFSVGGSFIWSSGYAGVSFTRFNSLYGIPGEEAVEHMARIDMTQDKIQSKGEWRVNAGGIAAIRYWLGTSDYAHAERITEDGENLVGTRFTNREREARVEVQHQEMRTGIGVLRGAAGVQWGDKKLAGVAVDEPVDALLDPAKARTVAGFVFEELEVTKRLRLQAAARIESADLSGRGLSDFTDVNNPLFFEGERAFKPFSAGGGVLYELGLGVVARLNAQYVERAPEAQELFSKGVHEATETFEIGNPNLGKEKARTVELGFKKAQGPLRFDASAFYTKFDGFIFKQLTGVGCGETLADCGVEDELSQVVFRQRDATFRGVELAAQYDVAPIWRGVWGVEGQYDFVRATFDDGGNVPRIPPHRLGGGLYYRDGNWLARVGLLHAFRQDETASEETATKGYTLLNAELSYTVKADWRDGHVPQIKVGIKGENLLDDDVRNHVSFKKDEVLLPGASVKVFGSVRLN